MIYLAFQQSAGAIGNSLAERRSCGGVSNEPPEYCPEYPAEPARHPGALLTLAPMDEDRKPVTIAEVIAGGQTIATHCRACGHRGYLRVTQLTI
jgi:hypothetical protein